MLNRLLFYILSAASFTAFAQETPVLYQKGEDFLTVTVENDLFGSGKDQHYTNGMRISWFNSDAKSQNY